MDDISEGLRTTHSLLSGDLPPLGLGELHLTIPGWDLEADERQGVSNGGGNKAPRHEAA